MTYVTSMRKPLEAIVLAAAFPTLTTVTGNILDQRSAGQKINMVFDLCHNYAAPLCGLKTATDNVQMSRCGCVSIKL